MPKPLIAPSILSADFARMGAEIRAVDRAGADWIHCDIMDAHFVPNHTFGPAMVKALRPITQKPLDVHLMISHPAEYVPQYAAAGADLISFHIESDDKPADVLKAFKAHPKIKMGVAIKPKTPLKAILPLLGRLDFALVMTVEPGFGGQKFMADMMPKVAELKSLRARRKLKYLIEIDGGVDAQTAPIAIAAGVDVMVAGTAVFGQNSYGRAMKALRGKPRV